MYDAPFSHSPMIAIATLPGSNRPASPGLRLATRLVIAPSLLYVSYHFLYQLNHATHSGLLTVTFLFASSHHEQLNRFDVDSRFLSGSSGTNPATSRVLPSALHFVSFAASFQSSSGVVGGLVGSRPAAVNMSVL